MPHTLVMATEKNESDNLPCVKEGDPVIVYFGFSQVHFIPAVEHRRILNIRAGNFHHSDMIGLPYGGKVRDRKTGRWCIILRVTPSLIMDSIQHRTQIIYQADANALLMMLDLIPGKTVIESGTGSGSFTVQLARAVAPGGHVHTFEFHQHRYNEAVKEFQQYGVTDTVSVYHRDVYKEGFCLPEDIQPDAYADAIFLDLPQPWKALPHAKVSLKSLGRLCTFSPCIEQIQRTASWLREHGFLNIRVFESLSKPWGVLTAPDSSHCVTSDEASAAYHTQCTHEVDGAEACTDEKTRNDKGDTHHRSKKRKCYNTSFCQSDAKSPSFTSHIYSQFQYPMRGHTSYLLVALAPKHCSASPQ